MKLTISGEVPSQKNGKRIVRNGNFTRIISSQRVLDWKSSAIEQLREQFNGFVVTNYPISMSIIFFYGTKRRKDLDNSAAGVMDALVKAEVITDDNVNYVDCLTLQYGGLDKENPRVEIYLDE